MPPNMASEEDYDDDEKPTKGKSRRELPAGAVATLKAWLLSPEHFTHPYPTPQDQIMLMQKTGIDKKQLKNWFTNARRRIWKPMLKKQIEQGTLAASAPGGAVTVAGVVPGLMAPMQMAAPAPGAEAGEGQSNSYQVHQPQYDSFGNPIYQPQQPTHPSAQAVQQSYGNQFYQPQQESSAVGTQMTASGSIGSLPPALSTSGSLSGMLSKHDSHAVLMELFQRDQDLVRQASEPKRPGASESSSSLNPVKFGSSTFLANSSSLSSWPHFSSISSLNNLGPMKGVKSITSLSGADLASQGNLSKSTNLAHVKSLESMGKHDSYAFLEVFFGDRSSSTNLNSKDVEQGGRVMKRERDEDNDVGLSLDADESPSVGTANALKQPESHDLPSSAVAPQAAPLSASSKEPESGTLKRAYDDAMAAHGLISVSRSSERLTDLALPAKIQRTLSQEFLRQQSQYNQYSYTAPAPVAPNVSAQTDDNRQYPGQESSAYSAVTPAAAPQPAMDSDPSSINSSVEVPNATKCDLCLSTDVDTQLNPCGHYFHHRCLKPSLQTPMGQPKCPIDSIPIQSALLAIPADENQQQPTAKPNLQPPTSGAWSNTNAPAPGWAVSAEGSGPKA